MERRMKRDDSYVCPRCDHALVPVHALEGSRRSIIALTCPEPYCDHMQMVTRAEARLFDERRSRLEPSRQAN